MQCCGHLEASYRKGNVIKRKSEWEEIAGLTDSALNVQLLQILKTYDYETERETHMTMWTLLGQLPIHRGGGWFPVFTLSCSRAVHCWTKSSAKGSIWAQVSEFRSLLPCSPHRICLFPEMVPFQWGVIVPVLQTQASWVVFWGRHTGSPHSRKARWGPGWQAPWIDQSPLDSQEVLSLCPSEQNMYHLCCTNNHFLCVPWHQKGWEAIYQMPFLTRCRTCWASSLWAAPWPQT